MKCLRCDKDLGAADNTNADYVIADDFIVTEKTERFYAVTKDDTRIALRDVNESRLVSNLKRVEVDIEDTPVQKTGIVCPVCYLPTDTLIWGVHK